MVGKGKGKGKGFKSDAQRRAAFANMKNGTHGSGHADNGLSITRIKNTQITPDDIAYPQGTVQQSVIIPSTQDADRPVSREEMDKRIEETCAFLSDKFGGFTRVDTVGGWHSENLGLIEEPGEKVVSFSNKENWTPENQRDTIDFLREKTRDWSQEAVSYEIEDDLFFLKPAEGRPGKKSHP